VKRILFNPNTIIGLIIVIPIVLFCVFAPLVARHDPVKQVLPDRLQGPSREHPLGTDLLGRDVLSRLLYGGRLSLGMTFLVVTVTAVTGTLIGLLSGCLGGLTDEVIMRFVDVIIAFPSILLTLTIAGLQKPGLGSLAVAMISVGWSPFARVVRGDCLRVRSMAYVEAAISVGATQWRIAIRHVLPNVTSALLVMVFLRFSQNLLAIAALSFLGLGAQPPTPEWGTMLSEARRYMELVPLTMIVPGMAIFLTTLGMSLAGDGLRLALDRAAKPR
jgi:peptide/nickel transport system permease protein